MSLTITLLNASQNFLQQKRNRYVSLGAVALLCFLFFHSQPQASQFYEHLASKPHAAKAAPHSGYRSTRERVERSHKLYAESIDRRNALIRKIGPNPKELSAFPTTKERQERRMVILWDLLSPAWSCPHELQRLGPAGDGGKWVCGFDRIAQNTDCTIYSFGVEQQSAFEADLLRRSPSCQLYLFDGTRDQPGLEIMNDPVLNSRTIFKPYRLDAVDLAASTANSETRTLQSILSETGHGFIDILKIDTEGAEFDLLKDIIRRANGAVLPFGQLQLEIHAWEHTLAEYLEWWEMLERAGLRPFSRELNYQDAHNGKSPRVIEYGFINTLADNLYWTILCKAEVMPLLLSASSVPPTQAKLPPDPFQDVLNRLESKEHRQTATAELSQLLHKLRKAVPDSEYLLRVSATSSKIAQMINSDKAEASIGAITAIDTICANDLPLDHQLPIRFVSLLVRCFQTNQFVVVEHAAQVYARIMNIKTLEVAFQGHCDTVAKTSLENLQGPRNEIKRQASCIVLRQIAAHCPKTMIPLLETTAEQTHGVLVDLNPRIRCLAGDILASCIELAKSPEYRKDRSLLWIPVYEQLCEGLRQTKVEYIHGCLIGIRMLLKQSDQFFLSSAKELCAAVIAYSEHREGIIRSEVLQLLPLLAELDANVFQEICLETCSTFLHTCLEKDAHRHIALKTTGNLATALGPLFTFQGKDFAQALVRRIDRRSPKQKQIDELPNHLSCCAVLVESLGESIAPEMTVFLRIAATLAFTDNLVKVFSAITYNIRSMRMGAQRQLLDRIAVILTGKAFQYSSESQTSDIDGVDVTALAAAQNLPSLTLAIHTLANFGFPDVSDIDLAEFVHQALPPYLQHTDNQVRLTACAACCEKARFSPAYSKKYPTAQGNTTVNTLVTLTLTDQYAPIRRLILTELWPSFGSYLAQEDIARDLVLAANDEHAEVSQLAIELLGKIATHNAAVAAPAIRSLFVQLLIQVEHKGLILLPDDNSPVCLLHTFLKIAPQVARSHLSAVMDVLLRDLHPGDQASAVSTVACLGELAIIAGRSILHWQKEYMSSVKAAIDDRHSAERRIAGLQALSRFASHSGLANKIYEQQPWTLPTLLGIARIDKLSEQRHMALAAIGAIGAIDPYHKMLEDAAQTMADNEAAEDEDEVDLANQANRVQRGKAMALLDEHYLNVVFEQLMIVLSDDTLVAVRSPAVDAVQTIYRSFRLKARSFNKTVLTNLAKAIDVAPSDVQSYYLQVLVTIISSQREHIRSYLGEIVDLAVKHWKNGYATQLVLADLFELLATSTGAAFRPFAARSIVALVSPDSPPDSAQRAALLRLKITKAVAAFRSNLDDYLHLAVPFLRQNFESDVDVELRIASVQTIGWLSADVSNFRPYTPKTLLPLVRVLPSTKEPLSRHIVTTISEIMQSIGSAFAPYLDVVETVVQKVMQVQNMQHLQYTKAVTIARSGDYHLQPIRPLRASITMQDPAADAGIRAGHVKLSHLLILMEHDVDWPADIWREWLGSFANGLLKCSPAYALRATAGLGETHPPFSLKMLGHAFLSCWRGLEAEEQTQLAKKLKRIFDRQSIPGDVVVQLLELCEFLERNSIRPLGAGDLARYAAKCDAYAKAIRYRELQYKEHPDEDIVADLIKLSQQLDQADAAEGILATANRLYGVKVQGSWYERLGRWEDASKCYTHEEAHLPEGGKADAILGRMRCYRSLGEWPALATLAQEKWAISDVKTQSAIAPLAAYAAWNLGNFAAVQSYLDAMVPSSADHAFFSAVRAVEQKDPLDARIALSLARTCLDHKILPLLRDSYSRGYQQVVRSQLLVELEEALEYRMLLGTESGEARRQIISQVWNDRLSAVSAHIDVWAQILQVRTLARHPREDVPAYVAYANMARRSGDHRLAKSALDAVMTSSLDSKGALVLKGPPAAIYARIRIMHHFGQPEEALQQLKSFVKMCPPDYKDTSGFGSPTKLLARAFRRLATWETTISDHWEVYGAEALKHSLTATEIDPLWGRAWSTLALAHSSVVSAAVHEGSSEVVEKHVVPAMAAYYKAIGRAADGPYVLQDTLRLLDLLFSYGHETQIADAFMTDFGKIKSDAWLKVIPQLMARVDSPSPTVRRVVMHILVELAQANLQSLVWSLSVAAKDTNITKRRAALSILDRLRLRNEVLVEQSLLVGKELVRAAISWEELWHEGLEDASRMFYGDRMMDAMLVKLMPLHEMVDRGAETVKEAGFMQQYGEDLRCARDLSMRFKRLKQNDDLNRAWDYYYSIFRRLNTELKNLKHVDLKTASPKLCYLKHLELAIPGTVASKGSALIKIESFQPIFYVLASKQKPRRLKILGSDGKYHAFLLKGHEDLRLDERIMQLVGLMNTMLSRDREAFKRRLSVTGYPVVPLSPSSGLISWLDNKDTLHVLIRDYRSRMKIVLDFELRAMYQIAPKYERHTAIQKVEVFEQALEQTSGQDLAQSMWLRSPDSETWLDRRTRYSRDLAVMSFVGYVIGLGDRHPSNLLIDRKTGGVLHVDFGDCFEVAINRDRFPETVPFRLTRMMVNALECGNVEGTYRIASEVTMRILRVYKDSMLTMLQAFVHDPVTSWRLQTTNGSRSRQSTDLSGAHPRPQLEQTEHERHQLNPQAMKIINRVQAKLVGRDFGNGSAHTKPLDVKRQVDKLINQATSTENLAQLYLGWCSFW